MEKPNRRLLMAAAAVLAVSAAIALYLGIAPAPLDLVDTLPNRLNDKEFWQLVTDFSESGGSFRSDNFLSNENSYQEVIPVLKKSVRQGGVYMGVGPEQNFTYVLALAPKMAFIIDIRRQNMLELLLYKAFTELSADRADFVSKLFARPRPARLDAQSSSEQLFQAYENVDASQDLFDSNLQQAIDHLTKSHGFQLENEDEKSIRYVYSAFFEAGPNLSYTFKSQYGGGFGGLGAFRGGMQMPTYADLMSETDGDGHNWSFLSSEERFDALRQLQRNNLIVPLVGDFAGPKAIRAVGKYLKEHNAVVSAFYTSNVEQYLFQPNDGWRQFYDNVETLPVHASSVFIRAVLNRRGPPGSASGRWSRSLWSPIGETVKSYNTARISSYDDVIRISR